MAVVYRPIDCPQCGKTFRPNASHTRHCSPECRFKQIASGFSGDACWEWPLSRNKQTGYGQFTLRPVPNQLVVLTHRLSYSMFVGPIADGQCVMHTCDNRSCFNPKHLRLGSLTDNNRDMISKGRAAWQSPAFKPTTVCKRGHQKRLMPSGSMRCIECELPRKRERRMMEATQRARPQQ